MISTVQCVPSFKDRSFLFEKYVQERLSPAQIAALCFSSKSTVMKYLDLYGIVRRRGADGKTRSQLGYGEAMRGRRVVAHKREQELIGKMLKLRAEGLSYWKIAAVLNAWGIPTKTRRGRWSAKQVHQILVRVARSKHEAAE